MKKTKIVAAYLPQYHETEDNNLFWGKGYTDWTSVKNSKKQFPSHVQPKIPLNNFYYDLSNVDHIKWQVDLANKYGVDAFNIYHYWFKNGKQELYKPAELILDNKDINIEYLFTWDNISWVRSWSNVVGNDWSPSFEDNKKTGKKILVELDYGDKTQWEKHFNYLLPFFKDNRYLKIDDKPVFGFMRSSDIDVLKCMKEFWNNLALKNGFPGMYFISSKRSILEPHIFDNNFLYEPIYSGWRFRRLIFARLKKYLKIDVRTNRNCKYCVNYDEYWRKLLKNANKNTSNDVFLGGVVSYDDSPRRGRSACIIDGATPEKFEQYFKLLYEISCTSDKHLLFLTAWNEWGEGAYLEPDEINKYGYLEALCKAKDSVLKKLKL